MNATNFLTLIQSKQMLKPPPIRWRNHPAAVSPLRFQKPLHPPLLNRMPVQRPKRNPLNMEIANRQRRSLNGF